MKPYITGHITLILALIMPCYRFGFSGGFYRIYAYALALFGRMLEADYAVNHCEGRVVATYAYVIACLELGAALAHQVGATKDYLAVADFDAEHFRVLSRPLRDEPTPFLCAIAYSLRENYELLITNYRFANIRN